MTWPRKLTASLVVTDAASIAIGLLLAQAMRFGTESIASRPDAGDLQYYGLAVIYGAIWLAVLAAHRTRDPRIIGVGSVEFSKVVTASLVAFGVLAALAFFVQADIARGYLAIALFAGTALLVAGRLLWRGELRALRRAGRCLTGAIVVGPRVEVSRVVTQLARTPKAGYRAIAAVITDADGYVGDASDDLPRIRMSDLPRISAKTRTRAVMVAGDLPGGRQQIQDLGWDLEKSKVELILVSRLTDVAGPRIHLRAVEGLPMVHVDLPRYSGINFVVKRILDVTLASAILLVLSPLFAVIALAITLTSPGPVLFRQERVGVQGSHFAMLKFRSMVTDAEARLVELSALTDGNGVLFKMKNDPRVTRVGAVLRRYSLDELPQLWNVLRGDMSLIGPRPPLPSEVEQYTGRVHRRLLIKPGITGLWQVSGRSNLSWEESIRLDLSYVENWSVAGDIALLFRTVRAVLARDGAY
jgi:exopolysaccharide biosynthesis polyprenyl glycosylphosphotransferase